MSKLIVVLCVPLAIDMFTCYLSLRSNRREGSPSGVPIINLFLYSLIIYYSPELGTLAKAFAFLIAVITHILIVFLVPMLDHRLLERKKQ